MLFELTNEQRKYLGLTQVESSWEKVKFSDKIYLYFDGDKLVKEIIIEEEYYREIELDEITAENRTMVLPKTAKGKPKKFNFTALQAMNGIGVYFSFGHSGIKIGNFSTQTTFYSEKIEQEGFEGLKKWLKWWIDNTTENDLKELAFFKSSKRQHCKYKEGDFFVFKTGRREYGFGRILLDVHRICKAVKAGEIEGKHYGLTLLMGRALIIKIYDKTSDSADIDINELKLCEAFPSYPIMDNVIFYGEYKIIGNLPLEPFELDFPISYSKVVSATNRDTVYLQYGLIYLETSISEYSKYLKDPLKEVHSALNPFRCEGIRFKGSPISVASDLRSPENLQIKREIFSHFGLDADKNYYENYEKYLSMK